MLKCSITKMVAWDYEEIRTISPNDFYKMIKDLQNKYGYELIINCNTNSEIDVEITIDDRYIE